MAQAAGERTYRPRADRACALEKLERKVQRDLHAVDYPNVDWVPQLRTASGRHIHDVVIVGAGQGGLALGFALYRDRIRNIVLLDSADEGREGPWVTFARMRTLRTPKYLTGPDLGLPDLGYPAWHEACFESPAWDAVERIPRERWMDYLNWFRGVVDLPIRNQTTVEAIAPQANGLLEVRCSSGGRTETLLSRKVILANGLEGSGQWFLPDNLVADLPSSRYAHTADHIDFDALQGRRIGVLGAGASAIDNAAEALEHGVARVDVFCRRDKLPSGERRLWLENTGFLRHFAELDDALRWRAIRQLCEAGTPPPPWSLDRLRRHENCRLHVAAPWLSSRMEDDSVIVATDGARHEFDFLVFGTGIVVNLDLRPELAAFRGQIATWRDRYTPPPDEVCPPLETYPYLGSGFELTERFPGTSPALRNIHIFNWGATLSMGVSGSSITGMKFGVARLITGITRDFYMEFAASHVDAFGDWSPNEKTLDQ